MSWLRATDGRLKRFWKQMLFWLAVPLCFVSRKSYFAGLRWKGLPVPGKVSRGAGGVNGEQTWNFAAPDLPEGYVPAMKEVGKA